MPTERQDITSQRGDGPSQAVIGGPSAQQPNFAPTAIGTPIGTAGFGVSIIMLSLFSTGMLDSAASGFFPIVAISTGFVAMLMGGLWDFRANNLFGATFGIAYACFLLTTGLLLRYVSGEIPASSPAAFGDAFGAYLLMWAVVTAIFGVGAYFVNLPALIAFTLLVLVYVLAGFGNIVGGDTGDALTKVSGWIGLLDGLAAWYLCFGIVLNDVAGRELLPMRPHSI